MTPSCRGRDKFSNYITGYFSKIILPDTFEAAIADMQSQVRTHLTQTFLSPFFHPVRDALMEEVEGEGEEGAEEEEHWGQEAPF